MYTYIVIDIPTLHYIILCFVRRTEFWMCISVCICDKDEHLNINRNNSKSVYPCTIHIHPNRMI